MTMPCKHLMPGCMKQMGCFEASNLPSRSDVLSGSVSYTMVLYASLTEHRAGLSIEPDLFPPISG